MQKQVGGTWSEVPCSNSADFHLAMEELSAGTETELELDLNFKAQLRDGFYRIVHEFYPGKQEGLISVTAKFSISE